jgi:hypothetical protein
MGQVDGLPLAKHDKEWLRKGRGLGEEDDRAEEER